ncbi:hypothetical protein PUR49_06425 [Streptomyces sp. BE147]|uniref:hypothetical protein n=1 Tax=Streptomyces sp. BE147 TaxID=3002524 RepID=UPI002E791958|nr:hypothetical protein [Streptomyces sp. BE147]MEE1736147.1 hypothetical protein [Streptomyces sp. BE147]
MGEGVQPNDAAQDLLQPIAAGDGLKVELYTYSLIAHGIFVQRLSAPNVTPDSRVFAAITEIDKVASRPFVGGAIMTIHNVAPSTDTVTIRAEVGSETDLPVFIYILRGENSP